MVNDLLQPAQASPTPSGDPSQDATQSVDPSQAALDELQAMPDLSAESTPDTETTPKPAPTPTNPVDAALAELKGMPNVKAAPTYGAVKPTPELCKGVDCSLFAERYYAQKGISLPRTAAQQFQQTPLVQARGNLNPKLLQPGDLLFYDNGNRDAFNTGGKMVPGVGYVNHVAVYIGNGQVQEGTTVNGQPAGVIKTEALSKLSGMQFQGATRPSASKQTASPGDVDGALAELKGMPDVGGGPQAEQAKRTIPGTDITYQRQADGSIVAYSPSFGTKHGSDAEITNWAQRMSPFKAGGVSFHPQQDGSFQATSATLGTFRGSMKDISTAMSVKAPLVAQGESKDVVFVHVNSDGTVDLHTRFGDAHGTPNAALAQFSQQRAEAYKGVAASDAAIKGSISPAMPTPIASTFNLKAPTGGGFHPIQEGFGAGQPYDKTALGALNFNPAQNDPLPWIQRRATTFVDEGHGQVMAAEPALGTFRGTPEAVQAAMQFKDSLVQNGFDARQFKVQTGSDGTLTVTGPLGPARSTISVTGSPTELLNNIVQAPSVRHNALVNAYAQKHQLEDFIHDALDSLSGSPTFGLGPNSLDKAYPVEAQQRRDTARKLAALPAQAVPYMTAKTIQGLGGSDQAQDFGNKVASTLQYFIPGIGEVVGLTQAPDFVYNVLSHPGASADEALRAMDIGLRYDDKNGWHFDPSVTNEQRVEGVVNAFGLAALTYGVDAHIKGFAGKLGDLGAVREAAQKATALGADPGKVAEMLNATPDQAQDLLVSHWRDPFVSEWRQAQDSAPQGKGLQGVLDTFEQAGAFRTPQEKIVVQRLAETRAAAWAKEGPDRTPDQFFQGLQSVLDTEPPKVALTQFEKMLSGEQDVPGMQSAQTNDSGVLFQNSPKTVDPFYSKLERVVEDKIPARASADQIRQTLLGAGVKPDEMQWTGTDKLLNEATGPISKQDLLDHLAENRVQVKVNMLGGEGAKPIESVDEIYRRGVEELADDADWWHDTKDVYAQKHGLDPDSVTLDDVMPRSERIAEITANAGSELRESAEDTHRRLLEDAVDHANYHGSPHPPKFSRYTLPGGKNYREMLLTLPEKGLKPGELPEGYTVRPNPNAEAAAKAGSQWIVEGPGAPNGVNNRYASGSTREAAVDRFFRHHPQAGTFKSGHFDEPNVLAHVRFDDRTGPNGERILHMAEVQSDWHQKGRKEGYRLSDDAAIALENRRADLEKLGHDATDAQVKELSDITAQLERNHNGGMVPDAPFKKTWHELALKHALRYAAENGYDAVSWDTGATSADRYDLSKQVSSVMLQKDGTLLVVPKGTGNYQSIAGNVTEANLADYIGKDPAEKLLNAKPNPRGDRFIEGLDLKVGGEGMKGFYDKMLPDAANKLGKRFGAKVEEGAVSGLSAHYLVNHIAGSEYGVFNADTGRRLMTESGLTHSEAQQIADAKYVRESQTPTHQLTLNPEMRASLLHEGQPLFQDSNAWYDIQNRTIGAFTGKSDFSSVVHELFHDWTSPDRMLPEHVDTLAQHFGEAGSEGYYEGSARAFERYLRDGKAPTSALADLFSSIRTAMLAVYKRLVGSPIEAKVHPEVRQVFDEMLGKPRAESAPETAAPSARSGRTAASESTPSRTAGTASHASQAELGKQFSDATPEYLKNSETWDEHKDAAQTAFPNADAIAASSIANKTVMSPPEQLAVAARGNELKVLHADTVNDLADAIKRNDVPDITRLTKQRDQYQTLFNSAKQALDETGSRAGKALNIRQLVLEPEDYSNISLGNRYTAKLERPLKVSEQKTVDLDSERVQKAQSDLDRVIHEDAVGQAEEAVKNAPAPKKTENPTVTDDAYAKALAAYNKKPRTLNQEPAQVLHQDEPLPAKKANALRDMAMYHLERGATSVQQIVDAITKAVPDVSHADLMVAVKEAAQRYTNRINSGRGFGEDVLTKGRDAIQNEDVLKLREDLDAFRKDYKLSTRSPDKGLLKELEDKVAEVGQLAGSKFDADKYDAVREEIGKVSARLNQGRGFGEEVLQVGQHGIESPRVAQARADLLKAKQTAEAHFESLTKPTWQTVALRIQRQNVISGISVGTKIATTTAANAIGNPVEEFVGSLVGRATGLRNLTPEAKASSRGEVAAVTEFFRRSTYKDMGEVLRSNANSLQRQQAARDGEVVENPAWHNVFSRIHNALTTPLQRSSYMRQVVKETEWAKAHNQDVMDPGVLEGIANRAYARSLQDTFFNANAFSDAFGRMVNAIATRKSPQAAQVAQAIVKSTAPVVKLPTNVIGRSLEYKAGIPYAAAKTLGVARRAGLSREEGTFLGAAWDGIKNMSPEEAGQITRALKRGGIGAGLIALGYYTKITPPKWMAHAPMIGAIEMGNQMRDYDEQNNASAHPKGALQALVDKGWQQVKSIIQHTPAVEGPARALQATETAEGFGRYAGEQVKSFVNPQLVQQVGRMLDPKQRQVKGFRDSLQEGVPGQGALGVPGRELLPEKPGPGVIPGKETALDDPVRTELLRVGYPKISAPKQKPNETQQQFDVRVKALGEAHYKALADLFKTKEYGIDQDAVTGKGGNKPALPQDQLKAIAQALRIETEKIDAPLAGDQARWKRDWEDKQRTKQAADRDKGAVGTLAAKGWTGSKP